MTDARFSPCSAFCMYKLVFCGKEDLYSDVHVSADICVHAWVPSFSCAVQNPGRPHLCQGSRLTSSLIGPRDIVWHLIGHDGKTRHPLSGLSARNFPVATVDRRP